MQILHTQKEFKDFEIKHLGEYDKLYVQRDALLPPDTFKNF